MKRLLALVLAAVMLIMISAGCTAKGEEGGMTKMANAKGDSTYVKKDGVEVIYLAGGCFWGMEKLAQSLKGVVLATSGYANGSCDNPTYEMVCAGDTGFRETVRVEYNPKQISLDAILFAYFYVVNPTQTNRQGNDIGTQYQAGIYYADDASKETVNRIAELERGRTAKFSVETGPLESFFDAEEYHQDYLDKNPAGYCHIPAAEIEILKNMVFDPGLYKKPAADAIEDMLSPKQYAVTQRSQTEKPFDNEYFDKFERGIYVDVVTGEPLFSSNDKFMTSCGWPGFSGAIDETAVIKIEDLSHGMARTEVRSRAGDSHLGHVFLGDTESPNGVRYCINSASLRFIAFEDMEAQGYGYLKSRIK
ncbi:MAG: peptide-methionine (S)-S-oxide reductase MsrA [Oscillospiraceae bacterium]